MTTLTDRPAAQAPSSGAGPRTYGNWQRPRSPGLIPRLGVAGSVGLLAGIVVVLLAAQARGVFAGLVAGALLLLALAPALYRSAAGRNGWQILAGQFAWAQGRARRQHLYQAPKVAGFGQHRLPGLLAPSRLLEVRTGTGSPVGLVHVPAARHWTVVLEATPEGDALVDPDTVDTWVGGWAAWLGGLCHEPSLAAVAVTVETSPDPGHRLAVEVARQVADGCPPFAAQVLRDCAATYPTAAPQTTARIAITFTAVRDDLTERSLTRRRKPTRSSTGIGGSQAGSHTRTRSRTRSAEEMTALILSRLPGLLAGLAGTGAGEVRVLSAADLAATVRVAFDPAAADELDEARAAGRTPEVAWEQAGPAGAVEDWDSYRHDDAASVTWAMVESPRGAVTSRVLMSLLGDAPGAFRKRVTLLYRPHPASDAAGIVDADVRTAIGWEGARAGEARATETAALAAARQTAREEATGAGLTRFSLLVTATTTPGQLDDVAEHVVQAGRASRIRLRRCYGSQSAAFSAALGLGVVLPAHVTTTVIGTL